jgi:hypothetical protein
MLLKRIHFQRQLDGRSRRIYLPLFGLYESQMKEGLERRRVQLA